MKAELSVSHMADNAPALLANNVTIREARASDAEAVASLYLLLTSNPAVNVKPERLAAIAAHDDHFLLVAEVEGKVCGTIFSSFCMDAMFGEQTFTLVDNVIVYPAYRRHHIGAALFAHVESMSLARMSSKIMLLSAAEREDAHAFFTRLGFSSERKRGFVKYRRQFSEHQVKP